MTGDNVLIPPYEVLAIPHNQRVSRIPRFSSRGSIELRWTDEDGKHFAPGDVDAWIVPPDLTALYVSKLGERIMWLGSGPDRAWIFDFRGEHSSLFVAAGGDVVDGSRGLPVEPAALLALAGMTPLPDGSEREPQFDTEKDAYIIEGMSNGIPLRLFLDRRSQLPVAAEILAADGQVVLSSRMKLSRYTRLSIRDAGPLAGPKLPTLIDVISATGDLEIKLSLPEPTDQDVRDEFYDLDWLIDRFRPDRIEGVEPLAGR